MHLKSLLSQVHCATAGVCVTPDCFTRCPYNRPLLQSGRQIYCIGKNAHATGWRAVPLRSWRENRIIWNIDFMIFSDSHTWRKNLMLYQTVGPCDNQYFKSPGYALTPWLVGECEYFDMHSNLWRFFSVNYLYHVKRWGYLFCSVCSSVSGQLSKVPFWTLTGRDPFY